MVIESGEEDLSLVLDMSHKKRKRLTKATEASSQPQDKAARVIKRPTALTIREPNPEDMSKIAATLGESDNSNPGVEGNKVKNQSITYLFAVVFSLTNLSLNLWLPG